MGAAPSVLARMPIRRRVATPRPAAGLTSPQMHPPGPGLHALLAYPLSRLSDRLHRFDMGASPRSVIIGVGATLVSTCHPRLAAPQDSRTSDKESGISRRAAIRTMGTALTPSRTRRCVVDPSTARSIRFLSDPEHDQIDAPLTSEAQHVVRRRSIADDELRVANAHISSVRSRLRRSIASSSEAGKNGG